jgi:ribosomal protein L37AE/L43A
MPMNRVQFQPGLSMPEFLSLYGTEQKCEAALIARRWPAGFVCPRCGICEARTTFVRQPRRYWQCAGCQHQCSVTSGTLFEASKLPLTSWFLAMQLLTQSKNNVSALELKRHLGVCYRTAWLVKHKILEGMRLAEADRQLTGRVEIDDAYLGGERSGGKTGRGSENKVPFVAAVQTTEDGLPHLACLSPRPFTNEAVQEFIARHTALPLTLVSDGLGCFKVAAGMGAAHEREITGGGKASVLNDKFRAVNTLIGNLKTALTGTYHAIKFAKYAYRYLAEVQFRFNRRYDLRAILCGLLTALVRAPRRPERGIRVAEVHH